MAKRLTTESFIEKAKMIHGKRYLYDKTNYTGQKEKIIITCRVHGDFEQLPSNHLSKSNCPKCGKISATRKIKPLFTKSTRQFVTEARQIHGNIYSYKNTNYTKWDDKVIITCNIHGNFTQTPSSHLRGAGCPQCANIKTKNATSHSIEYILEQFSKVHGDKYDYSKVKYINLETHINIICKTHGLFTQTPNNHMRGTACPSCAAYGFNPNKPAILYYLSINNGQAYKIGITNRTVRERFGSDMQYITILKEQYYEMGQDAYDEEQRILKQFKEFKYIGPNLLQSGNTELFIVNIDGCTDISMS